MKLFNTKAFSLIEVMVAVGILGIMSVGIMSMTDYGFKSQAAVEQKFAANSLQSQIYNLLATTNVCNINFGTAAAAAGGTQVTINAANTAPAPFNFTTLNRTVTPTVVAFQNYNLGTGIPTYENNSIRILSMQLSNFQPVGAFPTTKGQYDLILIIEKNKASTGVPQFAPKIIKLDVTLVQPWTAVAPTATQHNIDTCIAFGGNADQIWTKNADNTIFYNGANVGVGTSTPATQLEIASTNTDNTSIFIGNNAVGGRKYGLFSTANTSAVGAGKFSISDVTAGNTPRLVIDNTGNVGIGTTTPQAPLNIAGNIQRMVNVNSTGTDTQLLLTNTTPAGRIWAIQSSGTGTLDSPGNFGIQDITALSTRLVISNTGNVGIGTTTPTAKLEVNGTIKPGPATIGAACSPAGAIAYDTAADTLVFCKASPNGWTSALAGFSGVNIHSFPACTVTSGSLSCPPYTVSGYNFSYIDISSYCRAKCGTGPGSVSYSFKNASRVLKNLIFA